MPSLKDVANKAGVSVAAASAALGNRPSNIGVSAETRSRILSAAKELRYRRNPLAASLRTGRTYNIGVWLPNAEAYLTHPQGARNLWTICRIAARHGYHVSIVVPEARHMDPRLMDGCLIMDEATPALEKGAARLTESIPVLSLGASIPGAIFVRESRDWLACRQRAAEYLYDLGHRRVAIAHLEAPSPQDLIQHQFEEAARARGIAVDLHSFSEVALDRRYPTIGAILDMKPLPTAVFAIDDDYARALIPRLIQRGVRVPEDLSVFSGSTLPDAVGMGVGLTGLVLHFERKLEELFGKFVEIIESGSGVTEIPLQPFDVDLVERDSCAPPRK